MNDSARRQGLQRREVRACRWQEGDDTGAAECEGSWLDRWKTYGWLSGRVVQWWREEAWRGMFFVMGGGSFRLTQHGCGT